MSRKARTRVEKKGKSLWVVVDHFVPGWTARLRLNGGPFFFDSVVEVRVEKKSLITGLERRGKKLVLKSDLTGEQFRSLKGVPLLDRWFIKAELLRKVPLSAPWGIDLRPYRPRLPAFLEEELEPMVAGKRRQVPKEQLAHVARLYVEALENPKTRRFAARAVAEKLKLPRQTVRNWLHRARGEGMLSETSQGYTGGGLTKYGQELLGVKGDRKKDRGRKK